MPQSLDESKTISFSVEEAENGMRLDLVIAQKNSTLSRSRFQSLIKQGQVSLSYLGQEPKTVTEPKYRVQNGEHITINLPPPQDPTPQGEDIPLDIVFEDEHLIVVNKPAGLVVHPGAGNWSGTLVNAVIYHCGKSLSGIGGVRRPGIVHRLDKETSGLLVIAKDDQTHNGLSEQFADHGRTGPLVRAYQALVWGKPQQVKGTIETRIGRAENNRIRQKVLNSGGREAITHYQCLEAYCLDESPIASLIECRLETGRTHQIRVHMDHIGHPLIADPDYGLGFKSKINKLPDDLAGLIRQKKGQLLHAGLLGFAHPLSKKELIFKSELPTDMKNIVEAFQKMR